MPPVLGSPVNTAVVSAAVNHDRAAALVRSVGGKQQQLWLGNPDKGDPGRQVPALTAKSISTPAWVSWPSPGVFVAADGGLFYVPAGTGAGGRIDLSADGFGATVSAVAAAPDSRRIAFVASGHVYVTTVLTGSGAPVVTAPRAVPTDLADITAVAWSRENRIVVAGRRAGASTLEEVSIDGVGVDVLPLTNLANLTVTRLVGYPRSPLSGPGLSGLQGFLMIEASNRAWRVFTDQVGELFPENRQANGACTAPFFVD